MVYSPGPSCRPGSGSPGPWTWGLAWLLLHRLYPFSTFKRFKTASLALPLPHEISHPGQKERGSGAWLLTWPYFSEAGPGKGFIKSAPVEAAAGRVLVMIPDGSTQPAAAACCHNCLADSPASSPTLTSHSQATASQLTVPNTYSTQRPGAPLPPDITGIVGHNTALTSPG